MPRSKSRTRHRPRSNPRGILDVHAGGYGFVRTAEGEFFVPEAKMGGAFDGDLVEVVPLPDARSKATRSREGAHASATAGKLAARVVCVVDRAHDVLVGRYEVAEPFGVVVPEDARIPYDIFTMRADYPDVPDGSLVRVRITTFPSRHTAATGAIEEVLGRADDETAGIDIIVARHKLETVFSEAALADAAKAVLDIEGALAAGYRDVRGRFTFTIDPADAKDFDDALSIDSVVLTSNGYIDDAEALADTTNDLGPDKNNQRGMGGSDLREEIPCHPDRVGKALESKGLCGQRLWRVGVHIADVAHYVEWNSSLDLEARRRATSVYLADRVIPMLPEELSGDLCSLKPGETRRAMTVDLYVDDAGNLVDYELYPALIRSDMRLTYDEAQEVLDGEPVASPDKPVTVRASSAPDFEGGPGFGIDSDSASAFDPLMWRLKALSRLAKLRAASREAAGGLDFDTVEAKVRLDDEGHPLSIDLRRRTEATSLVEEAMILTNETVAAHLRDARFPCIYRVHDRPSPDSLAALVPVLQEFSWFKNIDRHALVAGEARAVQAVMAASAGRPESELVSSLVLRAMKRAVYRPECMPHYGLASNAYAHFTSPIRRYPDLVVHRMLKAQLTRRPQKFDQEVSSLPWLSEHSSDMERVAERAARESQELKIVEYMERCIGQTFTAVVSGVASYGLYVRLENTAEGLVHVKDLGREYFALDTVLHRLTGQDSGVSYRLGQRVAVVLESADVRMRRLGFKLAAGE